MEESEQLLNSNALGGLHFLLAVLETRKFPESWQHSPLLQPC